MAPLYVSGIHIKVTNRLLSSSEEMCTVWFSMHPCQFLCPFTNVSPYSVIMYEAVLTKPVIPHNPASWKENAISAFSTGLCRKPCTPLYPLPFACTIPLRKVVTYQSQSDGPCWHHNAGFYITTARKHEALKWFMQHSNAGLPNHSKKRESTHKRYWNFQPFCE